ncbi:MAG TPA: carbonic anhydrase [Thermosynechococcaceae cyanobacterium]
MLKRRNVLRFGAGAIGTSAMVAIGSNLNAAEPTPAAAPEQVKKQDLTPEQAIELLLEGNRRFVDRKQKYPNQTLGRLVEVAKGQKPFAAVLSCADSRVPAEIVFDQGLGDLFVCRVAGNVATPEEIGSLEFGSLILGTKVIMVLGHKRCGAVDATLKGASVPGQIGSLLDAIRPALQKTKPKVGGVQLEDVTRENVRYQIEKLKTSPVITQLIQDGKLKIIGGYYDLDTGAVTRLV